MIGLGCLLTNTGKRNEKRKQFANVSTLGPSIWSGCPSISTSLNAQTLGTGEMNPSVGRFSSV